MANYISTFTTGFSDVISAAIKKLLPGVKIIKVYDGVIYYSYDGKSDNIKKVIVLNNTFLVIKEYHDKFCYIDSMIKDAMKMKSLPRSNGSFRVRYSLNNKFVGVNKSYTRRIEDKIAQITKSRIDRVSPQTEYWFMQRSENVGFFCRLLSSRKFTEKNLCKGELRPEFAYLMCMLGKVCKESIVLDPFAGYGSIPKQLKLNFQCERVFVSDIDEVHIKNLKSQFKKAKNMEFSVRDALDMKDISTASIDYIITDPPWGYYEKIADIGAFYVDMLNEFYRVQNDEGVSVILSARKEEFVKAVNNSKYRINKQYNTLVNGKKAAVFIIKKNANKC